MALIKNTVINTSRAFTQGPILLAYGQIQISIAAHYITNLGQTWGWGLNTGRIGDGITGDRGVPVSLGGSKKTFCKIDSNQATLAIDKNGQLWGWGSQFFGNIGDNTTTTRLTPVSIVGTAKTFCHVTVASSATLAIDNTGRVWGWGRGSNGMLGDNISGNTYYTPIAIAGVRKTFCQISAKNNHTAAIDKNGRVWTWGGNSSGQLGDGTSTSRLTPVSVAGAIKTFCKITVNSNNTYGIDKNGRVWAWGGNSSGQLGDNTTVSKLTPVGIAGITKTFCEISAEVAYVIALDKNGMVWGWGTNTSGQIGDGTLTSRLTPVSVAGATKTFCKINAGNDGSIAIDKDGYVWAWGGTNTLGINKLDRATAPQSIAGATKTFCSIVVSYGQGVSASGTAVAIDKNGIAWAWGQNPYGEIGDNTLVCKATPVNVAGATKTFCQISIGGGCSHTMAIDKNGMAWGWGLNNRGQLGDGTQTSKLTPVSIAGATKTFCKIATGLASTDGISIGIDKNGRVWAWGSNAAGALGINSLTPSLSSTPVSILGAVKTFCHIAVGRGNQIIGITNRGRAWGWGANSSGQLGDGTSTSRLTPVSVAGAIKTFCKIAVGNTHALAITNTGRLWAWGTNASGQLGDNTTLAKATPVSVGGTVKTFCQIAAGNGISYAIDKYGKAWAWGSDTNGTLGTNTNNESKSTPVAVFAANKTFCYIAAASSTAFAIDKNGMVWAWGNLTNGLNGANAEPQTTPIRVCNI